MATYGYKPTSNPSGYRATSTTDSINQRGTVPGRMSQHGWATDIEARIGRVEASIPEFCMAVWDGSYPTTLLGKTDTFNTGTYMTSASDGIVYSREFQTSFRMFSGQFYTVGFVGADARYAYGYQDPTGISFPAIPGFHLDEFRKSVSVATPQDPFDPSSSGNNAGLIAIWVIYDPNVAPSKPLNADQTPAAGAVLNTFTPTFHGKFVDGNQVLSNGQDGDYITLAQVEIYQMISGQKQVVALMGYIPNATDVNNAEFNYIYDGPELLADETYYWSCRVADAFGVFSEWSNGITFSIGGGEIVDVSTPTGLQHTRTPGPFVAEWYSPTGDDLEKVKLQITNRETGLIMRESEDWIVLGSPVATGGSISVSWASTGFGQLPIGASTEVKMKGMDENDVPTGWSAESWLININAAPSIPIALAPSDGATSSEYPLFRAYATDIDDSVGTGWEVFLRFMDELGNELDTVNMTYLGSGYWEYQSDSGDLSLGYDEYTWDMYAYDSMVYSSGNDSLGPASLSPARSFTYTEGPSITVSFPDPDEEVNTNIPNYDWNFTDQERYRVRVYQIGDDDSSELIYDTGEITSSDTDHLQEDGYLADEGSYILLVDAWNSLNEQGTSLEVPFTVETDVASPLTGFEGLRHRARFDVDASAIILNWDQSSYTTEQFQKYIVMRRRLSGGIYEVDDEIQDENRRIFVMQGKNENTVTDYLPASGVLYRYSVKQVVKVDGATLTSPPVYFDTGVEFRQTIICDARQPGARRAVFQYRTNRDIERNRQQKQMMPLGAVRPTMLKVRTFFRKISMNFLMIGSDMEIAEMVGEIDKMDFYGGPLCYRDKRTRRFFGEIESWKEGDPQGGRAREINIDFLQTDANEDPNRD